MATPESKVKDRIKAVLKRNNIWYFMPIGGPFSAHGVPDFVCCWRGCFLGIEAKAPGKRKHTTENQKRTLSEIETHGGMTVVVDDVSQLIEFLEKNDA